VTTTSLPSTDATSQIEQPTTFAPQPVGDGITVLPSYLPVPGMGVLPAHAFLIDGPEPMLVDTRPGGSEHGFRAALSSVTDPAELRWLWLTHTDRDHFAATLDRVRRLGARRVLSSHLPPATGLTDVLVDTLATVPGRQPWTGPDQAALDHLLAAVTA
jgi:hypothetical protein